MNKPLPPLNGELNRVLRALTEKRQQILDYRSTGVGLDAERPREWMRRDLHKLEEALRGFGVDPNAIPQPAKAYVDPVRVLRDTPTTHVEVHLELVDWQRDFAGMNTPYRLIGFVRVYFRDSTQAPAFVTLEGVDYTDRSAPFPKSDGLWTATRNGVTLEIARGPMSSRGFFHMNASGELVGGTK